MKRYKYAVLGAGRQGTACAYDMLLWGDAESVILADADRAVAERAARRVNALTGGSRASAVALDVRDTGAVSALLEEVDAFLSAVPYYFNLEITKAAIAGRASMCDLGGNTDIVRKQLELSSLAVDAGISIIPDCGQVPGMGTTLMSYAMQMLDEPDEVFMWDGGLPQDPKPPFGYLMTFNIAGLTNEYAEPPVYLREGEIVAVEPMSELEEIDIPPLGRLEAFTTAGGTSTAPWTHKGKLRTYQNKTLRYPGHFAQLRAFMDLGLWRLDPIRIGEATTAAVVPRDVFHALFEPLVTRAGEKDVVVIRIIARGKKDGKVAEAQIDLIDYYDETTGFTAMERTTGWDGAIVAELMARGRTPRGAVPVETAVPPGEFVSELRKRGFEIQETLR